MNDKAKRNRKQLPGPWKVQFYDSTIEAEFGETNFQITLSSGDATDHKQKGASFMPAYVMVDVEFDEEQFETYKKMVPAMIALYGGRYIAPGGKMETLDHTWSPKRLVILEFPSHSDIILVESV